MRNATPEPENSFRGDSVSKQQAATFLWKLLIMAKPWAGLASGFEASFDGSLTIGGALLD